MQSDDDLPEILENKNRREFYLPDGEEGLYKKCADILRAQTAEIAHLKTLLQTPPAYAKPEITHFWQLKIGQLYLLQDKVTFECFLEKCKGFSLSENTIGFYNYGNWNSVNDTLTHKYKVFEVKFPLK